MVAARLTLDPTGNWAGYVQKTSGTTVLDQDRDHNHVNEIDVDDDHSNAAGASITATTGTNWFDPTYDAAGNMTTAPKPSSLASGVTCKYDAWNRLVEVDPSGPVLVKHRYDGLGRRIDQATFPPVGFRHNHTYYNASWQILEIRQVVGETEHPETLQPTYQYVWSTRYIDAPVLQDYNSDQDGLCDDLRFYYLSDANFNVTTVTDTSGDALEHYVYDPYGKVTAYKGDWTAVQYGFPYGFRFGYTGREHDLHTGLYDYRNRYYHAQLGRFLSRDPIGYREGPNLYTYVSSNPVCRTDPSGKETMFTPAQKAYVKKHCKVACCTGINPLAYGLGFVDSQMAGIMTFALAEAGKHSFDAEDLAAAYYGKNPSDEDIRSFRDEMADDDTLISDTPAHSALRHCIGAGLLARATNCSCSQCLSDNREYSQLEAFTQDAQGNRTGGQSVRVTQVVLHNNYVGRECAGCVGSKKTWTPRLIIPYPVFLSYPILSSKQTIIDCCVRSLKTGYLDLGIGNKLKGTPEIIKIPGYVIIPKGA